MVSYSGVAECDDQESPTQTCIVNNECIPMLRKYVANRVQLSTEGGSKLAYSNQFQNCFEYFSN